MQLMTQSLIFERSTKGAHLYVSEGTGERVVDTVYIRRTALPSPPHKIVLTISEKENG